MFRNFLLGSAFLDSFKDENGSKRYVYGDVWTGIAQDALMKVFLYSAIALAVVLLAVGIFVRFRKTEILKGYLKTAFTLALGFAATVIVTMLALEFFDMHEKGALFGIVIYPSVALGVTVVLSIAACYVCSLFSKKTFRISLIVCGSLCAAALIALFVCLGVYFASGNAADTNGVSQESVKNLPLYLCSLGIIAAIALICVFMGKGEEKGFETKHIAYAAVCISMSFALSYIKLFTMPQGGSVTLASLLPLMLYSYIFGVRKGVFAGVIYGILQAVQDPWILHPAQFLLDYPIAFAAIGITGMFRRINKFGKLPQVSFTLGAIAASCIRFICHVFSGVFAFSEFAFDGSGNPMNVWLYSTGYNSFVFIDIAIVIVIGALVLSSKSFVRELDRHSTPKAEIKTEEQSPEEIK